MQIYPASTGDIEYVIKNMRMADRREVAAATGWLPTEAARLTEATSRVSYAVFYRGEPVSIFGVCNGSVPDEKHKWGIPWMVSTALIEQRFHSWLRLTPTIIDMVSLDYDVLWNLHLQGNNAAFRWLVYAGFHFDHPIVFGPFAQKFNPFYKLTRVQECV